MTVDIVKFLLWQRGGWKLRIGGPGQVGRHIQTTYSPSGACAFDHQFLGERIYQRSLAERIEIQLPDEKSRRVGQSIAAASLPELAG